MTGAEVVVAGGTSALSQKVLEAIFGDQAIRNLAAKARTDLLQRVDVLLDAEAARYLARTGQAGVETGRGDELRRAAVNVERARSQLDLTAGTSLALPRADR